MAWRTRPVLLKPPSMPLNHDRLCARAEAILAGRANGHGRSVLRHLALRQHGLAMLALAARATKDGGLRGVGRPAQPWSVAGPMRRAYRTGTPCAAQNIAVTLFNAGSMAGYRVWLRRAGRAGASDAAAEARRLGTGPPHALAGKLRRVGPHGRYGG